MPRYRVELHSHCKGDPVDLYLGHTLFQHIDRAKEVVSTRLPSRGIAKFATDGVRPSPMRANAAVLLIPGMEAEVERRHLVV